MLEAINLFRTAEGFNQAEPISVSILPPEFEARCDGDTTYIKFPNKKIVSFPAEWGTKAYILTQIENWKSGQIDKR